MCNTCRFPTAKMVATKTLQYYVFASLVLYFRILRQALGPSQPPTEPAPGSSPPAIGLEAEIMNEWSCTSIAPTQPHSVHNNNNNKYLPSVCVLHILATGCHCTQKLPLGHKFNLLNPTGYVMHRLFNIQQLYVLPTYCIYVFGIYLRTNSDLHHLYHKLIGFHNRDEKCLLRGANWFFK